MGAERPPLPQPRAARSPPAGAPWSQGHGRGCNMVTISRDRTASESTLEPGNTGVFTQAHPQIRFRFPYPALQHGPWLLGCRRRYGAPRYRWGINRSEVVVLAPVSAPGIAGPYGRARLGAASADSWANARSSARGLAGTLDEAARLALEVRELARCDCVPRARLAPRGRAWPAAHC